MSSVTEVLMGCGSFTLNLDPATPRSIVEELPTWSTVCVIPGNEVGLDRAEVLSVAQFSGILRRRTDNLCTLMGPSITAWVGDEDGKGDGAYNAVNGLTSAQAMVVDLFSSVDGVNGIELDDYSSLPATPVWAARIDHTEVPRVFLDRVCRFLDWQYRVKPDGTIDIGTRGSLFTTTPTLLVVPRWFAEGPTDVSYRVVAGDIRATASDDDYATTVIVYDGTYGGFSTSLGGEPDGFQPGYEAYIEKRVEGVDLGSTGDAEDQANADLFYNYGTKNLIDLSLPLDDPRAHVEPGDSIYVYDPLQGLVLTGNQVFALGQHLSPIEVDVAEMTYPISEGSGVKIIHNTTGEVIDVTEFVLWGSGDASLRVGARWPTLAEVVNGRN